MKLLIILIVLLCFSCTHSQKNNEQSKEEEKIITNTDSVKLADSLIVGLWGIYTQEFDGILMYCNICPNIEFAKNGVGKITNGTGEEINFTYVLSSENTLQFSFDTKQQYFDETEYTYQYIKGDSEELKLISKKVNQIYNLKK